MSSHDCFELGRQSYLNKDYYHTLLWMNEAMQRLHNDTTQTTTTTKADILEYLAFAVFKQGASGMAKIPCIKLAFINLCAFYLQEIFVRHLI